MSHDGQGRRVDDSEGAGRGWQIETVALRFAVPASRILSVNADLVGRDPAEVFPTAQVGRAKRPVHRAFFLSSF